MTQHLQCKDAKSIHLTLEYKLLHNSFRRAFNWLFGHKYKYEVQKDITIETEIEGHIYENSYFKLGDDGTLLVRYGYRWDGASGPTWDTESIIFASLVHDVFYQTIRENNYKKGTGWSKGNLVELKNASDKLLGILIKRNSNSFGSDFRASYYVKSVELFGNKAANL